MTLEQQDKSRRLKRLLDRKEEINSWRKKALENLLLNIGPRIQKLGEKCYYGCGFHYGKVQSFGKLVADLALGFNPCMNWLEKNEEEEMTWEIRMILYDGLIEDVEECESGNPKWKQKDKTAAKKP